MAFTAQNGGTQAPQDSAHPMAVQQSSCILMSTQDIAGRMGNQQGACRPHNRASSTADRWRSSHEQLDGHVPVTQKSIALG